MNVQRHVVLFIASSLDGYIATDDESMDWLNSVEGEGDNGFSEFYETVDTVLLGKRTYDWIMRLDLEEFPYKDKDCYVFTRSSLEDTDDVTFIRTDIGGFIDELKKQHGKNIWLVGGGDLLHSFIQEKLVDELIITVAPRILGGGIPLFKEGDSRLDLSLKRVRHFNQFVELHYEVRKTL